MIRMVRGGEDDGDDGEDEKRGAKTRRKNPFWSA